MIITRLFTAIEQHDTRVAAAAVLVLLLLLLHQSMFECQAYNIFPPWSVLLVSCHSVHSALSCCCCNHNCCCCSVRAQPCDILCWHCLH